MERRLHVQFPSFAIGDSQIEIVEKTKYLGIQLDQHLVWDQGPRYDFLHEGAMGK